MQDPVTTTEGRWYDADDGSIRQDLGPMTPGFFKMTASVANEIQDNLTALRERLAAVTEELEIARDELAERRDFAGDDPAAETALAAVEGKAALADELHDRFNAIDATGVSQADKDGTLFDYVNEVFMPRYHDALSPERSPDA
jgi:hypothetical protein